MSADSIVKSLLADVPKAIAAAVIDMETGMLLSVKTVDSQPQAILDLGAAATKDLFEGDSVLSIENAFKHSRGDTRTERYFREIIITSENLIHVFSRLKSRESVVQLVVARKDANLGLVVMKTHEIANTETV